MHPSARLPETLSWQKRCEKHSRDFAEIMVPQNLLGIGMADLPTVDDRGYISAPQKPGLGYDIDRDKVEDLTLQRF